MEVWRKSSEPIPHPADQPEEMVAQGAPLLGRGSIEMWLTRVAQHSVGSDCRWTFSDLPDGDYIALLVRPDGSGGSQRGIVNGVSATIEIPAPTVMVSGVITLDGQPQAGAMIEVRAQSLMRPLITVTTKADGQYTAMLDQPTTYTIFVHSRLNRAHGVRIVELHDGLNQIDIPVRLPK